ncbi:MIZ/SP-RING zinc finger protein [Colletotrichum phormii]|uniref:MIZ/SP-RING zinc finger protein n=1 Tax=Colletotrichum phormii TaxID=359342 RepID=A0AAJ0EIG7_9PEZI|nr:MIZ/SP-RING zinc finger protein [Colletotrichum phormii]KAK1640328.1 MIZ/SP-RING zinc finger protein [Colletotrichum phormii]
MTSIQRHELQALVKLVNSNQLLNRQLSQICQLNGLTSSGVKAALQSRIVSAIEEAFKNSDATRFQQIQRSIETTRTGSSASPASQKGGRPATATPPVSMMRQDQYWGRSARPGGATGPALPGYGSSGGLSFKNSPFYEIQFRVGDVRLCDAMSQHRNMVSIPVKVSEHPQINRVLEDKSLRIMVFCAGDNSGVQEIAFPHQSEIKINGNEVKANLRGLKNKPGSTRPVDITSYLRLKNDNRNLVEFTYALTQKKFYLVLNVCRITSAQDLAENIKKGQKIPKNKVIEEISKKAADTDIVTTSQVLSLKCPLSYMRLDVPCRSVNCSHIQCFDATSYLQLQEQGPQWLCPICNKPAPYAQLAVDEYVRDILANTSKSLDQVTIEPDGQWRVNPGQDENRPTNGGSGLVDDDDDDDDDWGIVEVNPVRSRNFETPNRSVASTATPTTTVMSRESSTMPRGVATTSAKRLHSDRVTIDLTLSDDDEPAAPPPKRQQLQGPGSSNYNSNGYSSSMF